MQYTDNNGLIIKEKTDNYNRENFNICMNIIDDGLSKFYVATLESANIYKINTGLNKTELKDGYSVRVAIPSNSSGAVSVMVDNITVPVKKPDGSAITNFKENAIYTLTYYNSVFILASGENIDYNFTSVGTDGSNVLETCTFIGSDGEIHAGTMKDYGTVTKQLGINETFTLSEGHIKSLTVNQNIPLYNPNWSDIHETNEYTVGKYMYNTGANYTLFRIPNNYYINGCNWVSAYTPELKPENIVSGKNILGIQGTATIENLGGKKVKTGTGNLIISSDRKKLQSVLDIGFIPRVLLCYEICATGYMDLNPNSNQVNHNIDFKIVNNYNLYINYNSIRVGILKQSNRAIVFPDPITSATPLVDVCYYVYSEGVYCNPATMFSSTALWNKLESSSFKWIAYE